jgi:hypothetical protein
MHFCIPFVSWLSSVYWTILKMCHLCFLKQKWSRENSLSGTLYQNIGNCMFLLSYQLYILAHSGVIDQNLIQFLARLFEKKKVELLSSLRHQRLGRLSFLSESISQKLSKVSIWNLEYLFTIKRGTNYNKANDPVICISRVICPCFDIVHRNLGYFFSIIKISQ